METVWTDARTKTLSDMWTDGKTATEIARKLGCNISRNAVLGKARRLKLPLRNIQPPKPLVPRKKPSPITIMLPPGSDDAVLKPSPLPPEENIVTPWNIGNVETGQCRWVYGEPRADASLCGEKVHKRNLCVLHHARAWQPAPKRQDTK